MGDADTQRLLPGMKGSVPDLRLSHPVVESRSGRPDFQLRISLY